MKAVVLAGGLGTRLAEETELRPKPMIEIGGRPILWHILKHYAHFGIGEFCLALGYKSDIIKRFFRDYHELNGDMTVRLSEGQVQRHVGATDDWTLHLMDTGLETATGGRVKRLESWLQDGTFMLTYGDGLCDIDLRALLAFHRSHGRIATVSAVRPPARFGGLIFEGDLVVEFTEKPQIGEGWINGGFMVLEPAIFDYLSGDQCSLEIDALERLAGDRQLAAYRHDGFWQCMDTLRDKRLLEGLWQEKRAPWKVWA
ncbi:MAG TPA: glucose-1-phosphate cytidylyltransferase [Gemmatimonadaceae bacterium]|nr:glucose-1-phosphate cytidylyltransferase [Gemmatimonadaceae bacterium]